MLLPLSCAVYLMNLILLARVVGLLTEFVASLRADDLIQELRDVLVPFVELVRQNHSVNITVPEV